MSTAILINRERYADLLSLALPRVIRTEQENQRMIRQLLELDRRSQDLSREERELAELLTVLIENYEQKEYPIELSTPRERLRQLMEDRGLKQAGIWKILGSRGVTSEVLSGKRAISKSQAKRLAGFFHVPLDVFL